MYDITRVFASPRLDITTDPSMVAERGWKAMLVSNEHRSGVYVRRE